MKIQQPRGFSWLLASWLGLAPVGPKFSPGFHTIIIFGTTRNSTTGQVDKQF